MKSIKRITVKLQETIKPNIINKIKNILGVRWPLQMKENTTLTMQPRLPHVKSLKAQHQSILHNKNNRGVQLAKNDCGSVFVFRFAKRSVTFRSVSALQNF